MRINIQFLMKLPLRYITALVILSLTCIFAYQVYWLTNLYTTQKQETRDKVMNAMSASDYNELVIRYNAYTKATVQEEKTVTLLPGGTHAEQDNNEHATDIFSNEIEDRNPTMEIAESLKAGLHDVFDATISPDIKVYCRFLSRQLGMIGIESGYELDFVAERHAKDSLIARYATPGFARSSSMESFTYQVGSQDKMRYVLTTNALSYVVLRQMAGILLTSFVILIILALTFWYLIHTLIRQKTLEEMKSDFTNNITHELKTPIAVAYAAVDALLHPRKKVDEERLTSYLSIIEQQLRRQSGMVEQILSMSTERRRTLTLHMESIEVGSLIDTLITQHRLKADRPVSFHVDISPANLTINADRNHASNMVSNLIDNAIKYSPDQADVTITARPGTIAVADQGIGIAQSQQAYVFDKFYRVPTGNLYNAPGYGLGLFYVKTLMEKHGGTVSLQSSPRKGSTFTLHFENNPR